MAPMVEIEGLRKVYRGGFEALRGVDLTIEEGEILALLGPNGAGKTTLISAVCGITMPTSGRIQVGGHDAIADWRRARSMIGLVPQEIALEHFETVWNTVSMTRGLYGRPRDDAHIEKILRQLSLWDKRNARCMELSGGMKRRVLIAKALSHNPRVLFLDEPTAGVDVDLRRGMWETVEALRAAGVTIILTTHYIEEAEAIADRVAVIRAGRILLTEGKDRLMERMGRKELIIELAESLAELPSSLARPGLRLSPDGRALVYSYRPGSDHRTGITQLLADLREAGLQLVDLSTRQTSLEEILLDLLREETGPAGSDGTGAGGALAGAQAKGGDGETLEGGTQARQREAAR